MTCKNCGVTVDDLQGVKTSISCSTSQPCQLCVEVAKLDNAIARLKMERYELKRNINRVHSPFIRIVPPEIIARISEFASTDFKIMGSLSTVILLSSVCSDWRRAVVETPHFWSSIKIDLPSISQPSDMTSSRLLSLATFIDEWIGRSGHLPLSISLGYGDHDESPSLHLEDYRPIFKILNQNSSRWHTLNITIHPTFLPLLQPDCLPLLERLRITYKPDNHHPITLLERFGTTYKPDTHHAITFPPTPCLNTVEIQAFTNPEFLISPNIGIGWDTVTHLSLESISTRNCFALLRQSPQLVHCTFHKVVDDINDHPLESPILSQLTYLSLHHQNDRPDRVLKYIKLPSLETLVLFNVTIDPVIALLERSTCSLQTLSLLNWQIRKTDKLIPLLQFLSPSLTRLAISRNPSPMRGTRNYLSLLIQIYTSQSEVVGNDFLPHLEVFEYREEFPSKLESSMLSNLPSRNYPKATTSISLRSAYIGRPFKFIPLEISPMLRRIQEDGILTYT